MRTIEITEQQHKHLLQLLDSVLDRQSYIGERYLNRDNIGRHVWELVTARTKIRNAERY